MDFTQNSNLVSPVGLAGYEVRLAEGLWMWVRRAKKFVYHHRAVVSGDVLFNHLAGVRDPLVFGLAVREGQVPVLYHVL